MNGSMLERGDRLSLGNGLNLRRLSAMELLEARREARELANEGGERPLCSNACLLARALGIDGSAEPLFSSGREVLIGLTAEEIEELCRRWDEFRRNGMYLTEETVERGFNPNFEVETT